MGRGGPQVSLMVTFTGCTVSCPFERSTCMSLLKVKVLLFWKYFLVGL